MSTSVCLTSFIFIDSFCHRYVGDFFNNFKNGNGILYFSNGDKRVGVWKDDKLHGPATYYYSGGRIDEETWEEDNKVSEKRRK